MKYFYLSYMKTQDILQHLLPEEILSYFDSTDILNKTEKLIFCLDEKHQIPDDFPNGEYEAKGFTPGKNLQDFPSRGKAVVLYVMAKVA